MATPRTVEDPHDLRMEIDITRDGDVVFSDRTSTAEMVRTCEELVGYWRRHNAVPRTAVLLTGTALVPPENVTVAAGDEVAIELESIGTLRNDVIRV